MHSGHVHSGSPTPKPLTGKALPRMHLALIECFDRLWFRSPELKLACCAPCQPGLKRFSRPAPTATTSFRKQAHEGCWLQPPWRMPGEYRQLAAWDGGRCARRGCEGNRPEGLELCWQSPSLRAQMPWKPQMPVPRFEQQPVDQHPEQPGPWPGHTAVRTPSTAAQQRSSTALLVQGAASGLPVWGSTVNPLLPSVDQAEAEEWAPYVPKVSCPTSGQALLCSGPLLGRWRCALLWPQGAVERATGMLPPVGCCLSCALPTPLQCPC